ncbi:site-specific integrase [Peribacillus sp. NPDC096540]|uniref:site-specific integrase n=1 Tax=Peribacillus sp. NPDC096540 TaxID=3390612 RepID=UPI003D06095D
MNYVQASDNYLMYLEVEKNYAVNTLTSYAFDLKIYGEFLSKMTDRFKYMALQMLHKLFA